MKFNYFCIFLKRNFFLIILLALIIYICPKPRDPHYEALNCNQLISGSRREILKRRFEVNYSYSGDIEIPSCLFVEKRGYFDYPISAIEQENKIAYVIVVYKNSKQFEQLFRAIYRKTNMYCIHVDKKSSSLFWNSIKNLTKCFDNVILMRKYKVEWGRITTLLPEIDCMEKLLSQPSVDWKYVINLTGEEFPLKSNFQLATIISKLNGSNWIEVESLLPSERYSHEKFPFGLTPYKGPVHSVMSRKFVEFVVFNETAQTFLQYLEDAWIPDETFYPTLNFNGEILKVPGAYNGDKTALESDLSTVWEEKGNRYKQWKPNKCFGFYSRDICIFGGGDISLMTKSKALFANKFHSFYEPEALKCLAGWIHKKSMWDSSLLKEDEFNYYSNLDFTKNHF